jgi:hypothetical protein
MRKLPIGIQSFEDLRSNDYLYVDKTPVIHKFIMSGKIYILSRPRRFGKPLLISTLEEIFKGNRELFKGLYIYDNWNWERKFPVIRIDWINIKHSTPEEIEISLTDFLQDIAQMHGVTLTKHYASDCFAELIRLLHQKTGERVVVLVDEYDVPILDAMSEPAGMMDEIRKSLHSFYKILKGSDDHLQFIFLTGVSKFSGLSVFSALNNPRDITLSDDFAALCGYTQEELERYFAEHIDETACRLGMSRDVFLNEIRRWYDGYSWDGKTSVYNPFSTMFLFTEHHFDNYWFRTGTPTFLIEVLKKGNQLDRVLEPITVSSRAFDSFNPVHIAEIPLLFQTGYLTVKAMELIFGRPQYTLGIPNSEVEESLLEHLLSAYTDYPVESAEDLKTRMEEQLRAHDTSGLEQCLREMIASIPYMEVVKTEAWYHSIMLLWLRLLGFKLIGEAPTNIGRIDAVWFFPGHVIVVEVKSQPEKGDISKLLDAAIGQIREKRYYERFWGERQVSLLGVAFAGNEIGCRIEKKKRVTDFCYS